MKQKQLYFMELNNMARLAIATEAMREWNKNIMEPIRLVARTIFHNPVDARAATSQARLGCGHGEEIGKNRQDTTIIKAIEHPHTK